MQDSTYRVLDQYRKDSNYADEVGKRYHFGEKHHSLLNAPSTPFLYYEPGRNGAGEYFGCGVLGHITPDPEYSEPDKPRYFVDLLDYQAFPRPVPAFDKNDKRRETKPYFNPQNAVRRIAPDAFRSICAEAGVQTTAPAAEAGNPPDLAAAFKAVADFCRNYPSMPGGLPTHDDRASVAKTNLRIIANWLGRELSTYKGLHLKVRIASGAGAFPRVPWVCILPPDQEVKRGIYAGICFGMEGAGIVAGCMRSVTNEVSLQTTKRTAKGPLQIDVGPFNDAYANPLEMRIDELDKLKLLDHMRKSLSIAFERLYPPAEDPGYWIFQGNPKYFDIDEYVRKQDEIEWLVRQYASDLKPGAKVLLWRSGKDGGVIAECVTASGPIDDLPDDAPDLYHVPLDSIEPAPKCKLRVLKRYVDRPIPRESIKEALPELGIIKFANNTNYRISSEEYASILSLGELQASPAPKYSPNAIFLSALTAIGKTGFVFSPATLRSLICSLAAKPFVILTGNSGTGKTKLAELFALWLSADLKDRFALVPVGADWTDNRNVLGFVNHLRASNLDGNTNGAPVYQSTAILNLIITARNDPARPFFLVLDEMNLSHVERYFADFLSALESKAGELHLHREGAPLRRNSKPKPDVPESLQLPSNLFVIGTVNVDETTYMFSPKVLDRANVLEFRMDPTAPGAFLKTAGKPIADVSPASPGYAESFVQLSYRARGISHAETLSLAAAPEHRPAFANTSLEHCQRTISELFTLMSRYHHEFGFRTMTEIMRYLAVDYELSPLAADQPVPVPAWDWRHAMDAQILQKILPKLHGSRKRIEPLLTDLVRYCETRKPHEEGAHYKSKIDALPVARVPKPVPDEDGKTPPDSDVAFRQSYEKLCDMLDAVRRDQFVSFIQ